MRTTAATRPAECGQILVIFSLALVAIVAMTGLVLDGGDTFVQQRAMQSVSDASAMAAGYAYSLDNDTTAARTAALNTAFANGYVHGSGGVTVDVTWDAPGGAGRHFTVTITKPHANNFAGVVGMPKWNVTTTATIEAGWPNRVTGAMPVIFNKKAFTGNGAGNGHEVVYDEPASGSNDVPLTSTAFNWTVYCNECNADSDTVDNLIHQGGSNVSVTLDDHISPLNAGAHTTLFSDLAVLVGKEFIVPIVDDAGHMVGWAMFHLTGSVGGSSKQIRGWFVSPINPANMSISDTGTAGGNFGSYSVKLTN
jgi:hypothetical protein